MNDFPGSSEDARLRRLLDDAVADVEPRESLATIRTRTKATTMNNRRTWLLGAGGAALATAAVITAVAVVGGSPGTTTPSGPDFAGSPTTSSTASSTGPTTPTTPTDSASPDPTEPEPATMVTVPVYYVGETSRGPRLFREFHEVPDPGQPGPAIEAAVNEALSVKPSDPDYRTPWPAGTTATVGYDGVGGKNGTWSILLSNPDVDLRQRPAQMSADEAAVAVEQLIYTVQAAAQDENRSPVQFYLERAGGGENRTDMVLGVPASEPLAEGAPEDVLSFVWIIDPAHGAEVESGFTVEGLANAFEANVVWELMQGDTVVKQGFTTAAECCTLAPYSFTVKAPPGDYTLVVHDTDPSGGEGFGPTYDTKAITIK